MLENVQHDHVIELRFIENRGHACFKVVLERLVSSIFRTSLIAGVESISEAMFSGQSYLQYSADAVAIEL